MNVLTAAITIIGVAAALVAIVYATAILHARPTSRAAWLLAATAPIWLLSAAPAGRLAASVVVIGIMLALVADLLLIPGPISIEVERSLPPRVGLGDRADGEYRVTSVWPYRIRCRVFDAPPPGIERLPDDEAAEREIVLEPGLSTAVPVAVRGRVRGTHLLGEIAVAVRGPLGLVCRMLHYRPADAITVMPSTAGVRGLRLHALQHRLRETGARTLRRRGAGTTFANLREYATGDDPRHVDWKASARRRTLITREFSIEQGQTVLIAVDAGRLMTQLAGEHSRFDHALSAALVLTDVAIQSGDQVGLMVFDDEVRAFVPPARGLGAMRRVRDALVTARASMVEPDYAGAFRALAARHRKRSLLVLFTDVIDPRASQALLAHTARSTARHLPLVVALRNDALVAAAQPRAQTATATLYGNAAAEELLSARHEALIRMRRAGVAVLDVSPERMAPDVVNRYLEIKGRAAL